MEIVQLIAFSLRLFVIKHSLFASVALLFAEESGIPLPIPGDAVVTFIGYAVSRGRISYLSAYILLLAAIMGGSSVLFYLSRRYGQKLVMQFGHLLHVSDAKLLYIEDKFKKYGAWVIVIGRHIPGLRIPITIFSGISGVTFKTFFWSTFVSVIFWIPIYLEIGRRLGIRATRLLDAHPEYYLIALLPVTIFIISLVTAQIRHERKKKKVNI
ncbi:MAG: DedA family protein [Candidatus Roizmanbacteria bacterium]